MFIKRVSLQDFGRLSGSIEFERNRCNVICQDNEYGKTTVMDAVLYTLYNFPTTGFSRDTLKPKDRYRPWNDQSRGPNVYVVELELHDVGGRNYILRADFNRQQPFTLHDADTRQPIPLDGMSFGQRYLRMALPSFTQCFFLRQDEKEGSARGQLVSVIEEAAASNRRETPGNVSEAIAKLAAPRWSVPNLAPEPVLLKNLIKRLDDRRNELRGQNDSLQRELDAQRREIEASDEMDSEIASLDRQIVSAEYHLLVARRGEKQTLLNRYNEGREAQAERSLLLENLEPYAAFDPARRGEVIGLLGDWKLARQRFEETRNALEGNVEPELAALQAELSEYPATAATLMPESLESLRSHRTVLADREAQLVRQTEALSQLEATLQSQGVPVDRLLDLHETDSHLSPSDREIIFEHSQSRLEAQTALSAIEQAALGAREQMLQSKTRKARYSTIGMGLMVVVVAFMVFGIVLLFTGVKFFGWVCLIAAAVIGVGSSLFVSAMRSRISDDELNPAIQNEMALNAQARQIREQLEAIEGEYEVTLNRLSISPEQIQELREVDHWKQAAGPWIAAHDAVARLQGDLIETREAAVPLIALVDPDVVADDLQGEHIGSAIARMEKYFRLSGSLSAGHEKADNLRAENERLQADFHTKDEALVALVQCPQTDDLPGLEEKAQGYLTGCEKALQLQTLRREYGAVQGMTEEEAAALQTDMDSLGQGIEAALAKNPEVLDDGTQPGLRAEELERNLVQARRDRDSLKERRNVGFRNAEKAVEEWRTKGPVIDEELALVEGYLAKATDFGKACELAHGEMANIAEQVYTQWAMALNERVNRILPLVNNRYSEVALSPELEISVFSKEAGRRLETREVQHLSKGARDQLLLAMRIAIAEYLSAHVGNLPLALDEPFAHWDDQRFVEGMRFLTRLSETHQVILLSCHSWRYAQLRETAPEIYKSVVFNKVG